MKTYQFAMITLAMGGMTLAAEEENAASGDVKPAAKLDAAAWKEMTGLLKVRLDQLEAKGVEVSELEVFPPPPAAQIAGLEKEAGFAIGQEFRDLLAVSGGLSFDWFTESAPIKNIEYGGNAEVEFLRTSGEFTLAQAYRTFQESCEGYSVDEKAQKESLRRCFPLYLADGAGNALVLKMDTEPMQIHLLKADLSWHFSADPEDEDRSLIGEGLAGFLRNWFALGAPATENLSEIIEACGGSLDADSPAGKEIVKWMTSPAK